MKTKNQNELQRLFIALHVPSELGRAIVQYEKELPFWRWYDAKELHLTIRFIGDTAPDKIDRLIRELMPNFGHSGEIGGRYILQSLQQKIANRKE